MGPRKATQESVIDIKAAAAAITDPYANIPLTVTDDHVIRMSVMTEPFHWHLHPNSDETFIVVDGAVRLETEDDDVELQTGQLYTVPAGVAHKTSPIGVRSVNLTVERADMQTERVERPH